MGIPVDSNRSTPARVAYVSSRYPPMRSSGTYRVEAMLRHLPEHGFDLIPVTLPDEWIRQQSGDRSLGLDDQRVHQPSGWLDGAVRGISRVPLARRVLREAIVPDVLGIWARTASAELDSNVEIDLVYSTGPPFSALVLADRIARRHGVPLVHEVRDPPSFNRRLATRSRWWKGRMRAFERRFLGSADAVITVTSGTRRRLLEIHPDFEPERIFVVTNGHPDIVPDISRAGRDPEKFTISYVGSFQGGTRARRASAFNPAILLPALRRLDSHDVALRVVGPVTEEQRRHIAREPGGDLVQFTGLVSREDAIAEMAAADVSLVLAEDEDWWIGRKVFESMAFSRRTLALVPESGDTAALLRRNSKASVVEPWDGPGIARAVHRLHDEWVKGEIRASEVDHAVQSDRSCVTEVAAILRSVMAGIS